MKNPDQSHRGPRENNQLGPKNHQDPQGTIDGLWTSFRGLALMPTTSEGVFSESKQNKKNTRGHLSDPLVTRTSAFRPAFHPIPSRKLRGLGGWVDPVRRPSPLPFFFFSSSSSFPLFSLFLFCFKSHTPMSYCGWKGEIPDIGTDINHPTVSASRKEKHNMVSLVSFRGARSGVRSHSMSEDTFWFQIRQDPRRPVLRVVALAAKGPGRCGSGASRPSGGGAGGAWTLGTIKP